MRWPKRRKHRRAYSARPSRVRVFHILQRPPRVHTVASAGVLGRIATPAARALRDGRGFSHFATRRSRGERATPFRISGQISTSRTRSARPARGIFHILQHATEESEAPPPRFSGRTATLSRPAAHPTGESFSHSAPTFTASTPQAPFRISGRIATLSPPIRAIREIRGLNFGESGIDSHAVTLFKRRPKGRVHEIHKTLGKPVEQKGSDVPHGACSREAKNQEPKVRMTKNWHRVDPGPDSTRAPSLTIQAQVLTTPTGKVFHFSGNALTPRARPSPTRMPLWIVHLPRRIASVTSIRWPSPSTALRCRS